MTEASEPRERLITIDDAAGLLRLSRKAVEQRVARGTLQSVKGKDGKRWLFAAPIERMAAVLEAEEQKGSLSDTLAEKYAQARYELGVRDGEAQARAQLTNGYERRERELENRVLELTASLATAEAVLREQERQAEELLKQQANPPKRRRRWFKKSVEGDAVPPSS